MNVPLPNLISFWKKKTETNSFLSCELWTAPIVSNRPKENSTKQNCPTINIVKSTAAFQYSVLYQPTLPFCITLSVKPYHSDMRVVVQVDFLLSDRVKTKFKTNFPVQTLLLNKKVNEGYTAV